MTTPPEKPIGDEPRFSLNHEGRDYLGEFGCCLTCTDTQRRWIEMNGKMYFWKYWLKPVRCLCFMCRCRKCNFYIIWSRKCSAPNYIKIGGWHNARFFPIYMEVI